MRVIWKIVKTLVGIFFGLMFIGIGFMVWDEKQLEKAIHHSANMMRVGASAWFVNLPDDRNTVVTYSASSANSSAATQTYCATLSIYYGKIRHAVINKMDVKAHLTFNNGIDFSNYIEELSDCDTVSLVLMAKMGFTRAEFSAVYRDGKIVEVSEPSLWD